MFSKRIVVTGMGAITPIGLSTKEFWGACQRGENGIGPVTRFDTSTYPCKIGGEIHNFKPENYMDRKEVKRTDLSTQFALAATSEALNDSGLLTWAKLNRDRVGVNIGSGIGGLETITDEHSVLLEKGIDRVTPFLVPKLIINISAGRVAIQHGFRGPNFGVVSACATANHSIGEAAWIIARGDADVMITGGTEATILPVAYAGFCQMKAMSATRNDQPDQASRPFDLDRDGFVMGEGAGIIVLESLEHALARGAQIYAEVVGYGASDDAFHLTAPDENGEGAVLAMKRAIERARISPRDINYVNAHGTSTKFNDAIETKAIKTVFGHHASKLAISSTKSMTGHCLGAAGGIEMIATIMSVVDDIVHPTRNLDNPDPDCDLDYVSNVARSLPVQFALSNGFGFGGHNASIVVGYWDDSIGPKGW